MIITREYPSGVSFQKVMTRSELVYFCRHPNRLKLVAKNGKLKWVGSLPQTVKSVEVLE